MSSRVIPPKFASSPRCLLHHNCRSAVLMHRAICCRWYVQQMCEKGLSLHAVGHPSMNEVRFDGWIAVCVLESPSKTSCLMVMHVQDTSADQQPILCFLLTERVV